MIRQTEPTVSPYVAAVMRWPSSGARAWAAQTIPRLCAAPTVRAVVLFGSAIRPAPSSYDLDCLYVFDGERPDLMHPPSDVDLRGYDASEVERLIASGHDLLGWTLRLGVLLCERDAYWSQLAARWRGRLPFPAPEVADARADQAERLLADLREIGDGDAATEQYVTALTHRARAALLRAGVFPASRPELPGQLRGIGMHGLAIMLEEAIEQRAVLAERSAQPNSRHAPDAA